MKTDKIILQYQMEGYNMSLIIAIITTDLVVAIIIITTIFIVTVILSFKVIIKLLSNYHSLNAKLGEIAE